MKQKEGYIILAFVVIISLIQCNNKVDKRNAAVKLPSELMTDKVYFNYPILVVSGRAENKFGMLNRDAYIFNLETNKVDHYASLLKKMGMNNRINSKFHIIQAITLAEDNVVYFTTYYNRLYKYDGEELVPVVIDTSKTKVEVLDDAVVLDGESMITLSRKDILDQIAIDTVMPVLFLSELDIASGNVIRKEITDYLANDVSLEDSELTYVGIEDKDAIVWVHDLGFIVVDKQTHKATPVEISVNKVIEDLGLEVWSPKEGHSKSDFILNETYKPYLLHYDNHKVYLKVERYEEDFIILRIPLKNPEKIEQVFYPQGTLLNYHGSDTFVFSKSNKDSLFIKKFSWNEIKSNLHLDFRPDLDTITNLHRFIPL